MNSQEPINSKLFQSTEKSFYLENLGCAKNQVDAEIMTAALEKSGWMWRESPDEAALIIVNTCGFIDPAKQESIERIIEFQQKYPGKKILVTGCLAQRYGVPLKEKIPGLAGIFGNGSPARIPPFAEEVLQGHEDAMFPDLSLSGDLPRKRLFSFQGSAYVKIAEGCDNRCTYCAIPGIRGSLRSRSVKSITEEVRELISRGTREVILIAQDLSSYARDTGEASLTDLIGALGELSGDFWLRMLYIHPDHFPLDILDLCKKDKRILPYFDLPFQHSSKNILKKMGRTGSGREYLTLINTIRDELPDAVIRSTFLVGFPGEGREDFMDLIDFQQEAEIDWLGVFSYSREEDTPAYSLTGPFRYFFSRKKAEKRKSFIEEFQIPITARRLDRFIGREIGVFIEEDIPDEKLSIGRGYLNAPDVDGYVVVNTGNIRYRARAGNIIRAKIIKRNGVDLEGILLGGKN